MRYGTPPDPEDGDLLAGSVQGHCSGNQMNFGGNNQELQIHFGRAWSEFAEHVLPCAAVSNPIIPRNPSNQPVLPAIDLNTVSIAERQEDWCTKNLSIPWDEIAVDPGKYYDTGAGYFSAKLDHPQNLETLEVINLAQQLLLTSVIDSPTPFRFLQAKEVILTPSTPPVQPVSPLRTSAAPEKTPVPDDTPPTPVAPPLGSGPSTPPGETSKSPAENSKGKRKRVAAPDEQVVKKVKSSKAAAIVAVSKAFTVRWNSEWSSSPRYARISSFGVAQIYTSLSRPRCSILTQLRIGRIGLIIMRTSQKRTNVVKYRSPQSSSTQVIRSLRGDDLRVQNRDGNR
ncbi:hypothetical protein B0H10DRAFT_2239785 [Mycena sp. CBHHK59/15]|nr:hypothetical protein B0H10DRAFT_2239785 [Mycena sp. CBHHK59/15]